MPQLSPNRGSAIRYVDKGDRRGGRYSTTPAALNPGGGIEAFVDVRLRPAEDSDDFLAWSSTDTTIDDAVHVTGPYDYLLHIRVCDTADLDRLLRRLKTSAEAAQTQTRIALRSRR